MTLIVGAPKESPELVIGLVGPIGTDLDAVCEALRSSLDEVGYQSDVIRLSHLMRESPILPGATNLPERDDPDYYARHMDAGDELRELFRSGDVLAAYGIRMIRGARGESEQYNVDDQRRRYATIVHSLKHEDEVALLRATYRGRFVLIGASSSLAQRTANLEARLSDQGVRFSQNHASASEEVASLLQRDEDDPTNPYGQHVRKTFSKADAFVWVTADNAELSGQVGRLVELIFGRPFITPTRDELAMFHASAAALRSADAGRQVGVAVTNRDGDLLVTGTNEVPRPGGGQYWPGDPSDARDFRRQQDTNQRLTNRLIADVLQRLKADGWLASKYRSYGRDRLLKEALQEKTAQEDAGPLESARVTDLLEFSRVVHAEMAAISEAAARGVALQGSTLYTTTYPCHLCARMVIAAGVERVVYIDPYNKSVVPEIFGEQIEIGVPGASPGRLIDGRVEKVAFASFTGVAPALFQRLFTGTGRKPGSDGRYPRWIPKSSFPRVAADEPMSDADALEADVVDALTTREKQLARSHRRRPPGTSS